MNSNYVKIQTVAISIGIARILIAISIICILISGALAIFSGFDGWKKDFLIYGIAGTLFFYLLSLLLKFIHDKMDKF
jgi:hypothetical protein